MSNSKNVNVLQFGRKSRDVFNEIHYKPWEQNNLLNTL